MANIENPKGAEKPVHTHNAGGKMHHHGTEYHESTKDGRQNYFEGTNPVRNAAKMSKV